MSDTSIGLNERAGTLTLRGSLLTTQQSNSEKSSICWLTIISINASRCRFTLKADRPLVCITCWTISSHRARAVIVITKAPLMAGSAAAVLLILGEVG